jgi:sugar lactone lactonase YvrE
VKELALQAELVLDAKAMLAEGPCWDAETQKLYWVDIMTGVVHTFDPVSGCNVGIEVKQYVGAVVLRQSGGLMLALKNGFHALDPVTGKLTPLTDPESHLPGNRFNDGKVDPAGRFWAGTMALSGDGSTGSLYRLDTDLSVHCLLRDIGCSNGLAWSVDGKTMYYIDTSTKKVAAFDYDLTTGAIDRYRVAVVIPEDGGVPDGMTIDAEGMLWVAQWGGSRVSRWNPQTGEELDSVSVPASQVTSCTFGGKEFDTLYITTAREGLDDEALLLQPLAGGLFAVRTSVKGASSFSFAG